VAVTIAFGTLPPEASLTVPDIRPTIVWALIVALLVSTNSSVKNDDQMTELIVRDLIMAIILKPPEKK
jgi:hypothetical protein